MNEDLRAQMKFDAHKKSPAAAYILWFFVGGFGAHRLYLGRIGSGAAQAALALLGWIPFFLGWAILGIWWLVDAFLIPQMVEQSNNELIDRLDRPATSPGVRFRTDTGRP